jgi:succinate-acetate transporter protein
LQNGEKKMFVIPILEIGLSFISIWWAIVLFLSPRLFDNLPQLYRGFATFSEPYHWGILFLIVAFMNMIGIVFRNHKLRKISLFLTSILFALLSAGFFMGDSVINTGAGVYAVVSFMALWGVREVSGRNG